MSSQVARDSRPFGTLRSFINTSSLIYVLAAAAAMDLVTLFRNVEIIGLGAEANPIVLYFLVNFGPLGVVAAKSASVLLASSIGLYLMHSGRCRLAKITLAICCFATIMAAFSNIWSA